MLFSMMMTFCDVAFADAAEQDIMEKLRMDVEYASWFGDGQYRVSRSVLSGPAERGKGLVIEVWSKARNQRKVNFSELDDTQQAEALEGNNYLESMYDLEFYSSAVEDILLAQIKLSSEAVSELCNSIDSLNLSIDISCLKGIDGCVIEFQHKDWPNGTQAELYIDDYLLGSQFDVLGTDDQVINIDRCNVYGIATLDRGRVNLNLGSFRSNQILLYGLRLARSDDPLCLGVLL